MNLYVAQYNMLAQASGSMLILSSVTTWWNEMSISQSSNQFF